MVQASFRESSSRRMSPFWIPGIYSVPKKPSMVFRLPPISRPVQTPGSTVTQRLGRDSLGPVCSFQLMYSSVQMDGIL